MRKIRKIGNMRKIRKIMVINNSKNEEYSRLWTIYNEPIKKYKFENYVLK